MKASENIPFAFFGTPEFAVIVLDELERAGLLPAIIVTAPDRSKGRGLKLTPPPVKVWADIHGISTLQPKKLNDPGFLSKLKTYDLELFIVAAYGKIIPRTVTDVPKHGVLNVHPSLLPKYRGPSPVETQILSDDRNVGVTIMQIDEEMDHGPVVQNEKVKIKNEEWPLRASTLAKILAHTGGKLLADTIPRWVAGEIAAVQQDHNEATYCKLIKKEDAHIDLNDNPYQNFLTIQAYDAWPKAYFFAEKNGKKVRVKITDANYRDGKLTIKKVIPEGKHEMDYESFLRRNEPTSQ
ncbi:methionyl-tRNA formyltransferase [Candidatus Wolfebacteria bacterium]|nr:methionyl-tRNA formyltransferase [Candidatus Wolfebacteria bacterium]